MKQVALAEVKNHLSQYLLEAGREHVVITKHGRPSGVLIGFANEDEWFEYRLENDARFVERIARARASIRAGKGVSWPAIQTEEDRRAQRRCRRTRRR
jgi:prevent-host-death family protein